VMVSIVRKSLLLLVLLTGYVSVMGAHCGREKPCTGSSEQCDSDGDGMLDGRCVAGICVSDEPEGDEQ